MSLSQPDATTVMKLQEMYLLIVDLRKRVTALEPAPVMQQIPMTIPAVDRWELWQGRPVTVSTTGPGSGVTPLP